jgi:hypothetical protein
MRRQIGLRKKSRSRKARNASEKARLRNSLGPPTGLVNRHQNGVRTVIATCAALGVAAFLMVAVGARLTGAAAQNDPIRVVALLDVQFLKDHADLEPTTNAERVRLASIESLFKAKLEASGRHRHGAGGLLAL